MSDNTAFTICFVAFAAFLSVIFWPGPSDNGRTKELCGAAKRYELATRGRQKAPDYCDKYLKP